MMCAVDPEDVMSARNASSSAINPARAFTSATFLNGIFLQQTQLQRNRNNREDSTSKGGRDPRDLLDTGGGGDALSACR